jgi:hypothetical protein
VVESEAEEEQPRSGGARAAVFALQHLLNLQLKIERWKRVQAVWVAWMQTRGSVAGIGPEESKGEAQPSGLLPTHLTHWPQGQGASFAPEGQGSAVHAPPVPVD